MEQQIQVGVERMNRGNWLKIFIPYSTAAVMTANLQNDHGETLRSVRLASGNNFIDIESMTKTRVRVKVDTPFETLLLELNLD